MVDLIVSGRRGGIDAGGIAGITPTGRVDWPCNLGLSKFSIEDDAKPGMFKGEYRSNFKSGLMSLAVKIDGTKGRFASGTLDLCSTPTFVTTETVMPPLLFT